jgi:DNA-binding MarR family transcriptional regulator
MTRWLDEDEMRLWISFLHAQKKVQEHLDRDLMDGFGFDLGDYEVLALLSESTDRRLRMSDLAEQIVMPRSRLTYRVDRLEREGLVEREVCPSDRRGQFAVLTPAGMALLRRAAPVHLASVRQHFLDHFPASRVRGCAAAFESMLTASQPAAP